MRTKTIMRPTTIFFFNARLMNLWENIPAIERQPTLRYRHERSVHQAGLVSCAHRSLPEVGTKDDGARCWLPRHRYQPPAQNASRLTKENRSKSLLPPHRREGSPAA